MPQIMPIRGLRYGPDAGPLDTLLAPPYDVIGPRQRRTLAATNPYNAVHLELADGGDERYGAVAALLQRWTDDRILVRDDAPALYVYEQRFDDRGKRHVRRGVIAGVEAQPWEEGAVKPHEFTMSGPKEDRRKLLEATRTQFSPVFLLARDRAGQLRQFIDDTVRSREPDAAAATPYDGDEHRLWVVEADRFSMRYLAPLLAESLYVADGHHRYETAVAYKRGLMEHEELPRDHPARFALAAIVAADDPGLVIRPIHRVVPLPAPADWEARLGGAFRAKDVKPIGDIAQQAANYDMILAGHPAVIVAINLVPGQIHVLEPTGAPLAGSVPAAASDRLRGIVPNILRYGVLEPLWGIGDAALAAGAVEYTHDTAETLAATGNPAQVAFLLAPVDAATVMAVADGGERMPQKSTFFHPKLGTGLVFHPLAP